jgi:uncharacterized protein YcfJ
MNTIFRSVLAVTGLVIVTQAVAEVTFYEHEDFKGRSFNTEDQVDNFSHTGFNDRASSVVVDRDWWQVCDDSDFRGHCAILRPGRYGSLSEMGLNNRISSVRIMSRSERRNDHSQSPVPDVADDRGRRDDRHSDRDSYGSGPVAAPYDYRRRYHERTYEANVTSVHAVVGPPEQRCWVEREKVVQNQRHPNAPGAIIGALIGGVLGHQVGGGSGKDLATAGGAVAGALVGANVNRDGDHRQVTTRDVKHCANTARYARPEYWDVTYVFRHQEHRMQTTERPGSTVTVNEQGEPRL